MDKIIVLEIKFQFFGHFIKKRDPNFFNNLKQDEYY